MDNFLVINFTGQNDKLGLKVNNNFFIYKFTNKIKNNELLISTILNFTTKHKAKIDHNFSIIVNCGPGSFSALRIAQSVAKGIKITKKSKLFSYKNSDLTHFSLENIEDLINKKLIQKKLIKPIYLS